MPGSNEPVFTIRPRRKLGRKGAIFCDEAGFTGNNLLDGKQEVFVFASVAISPERAHELVERTLKDYRLQGHELKGSRLLKSDSGRKAISAVFRDCIGQARFVSHLKKYALACKFFEYIFEPALAAQNSIFYGAGFHLFISTLLFACFRAEDASAEQIFEDFAAFMRDGRAGSLERIFPNQFVVEYTSNPLHAIALFAMLNRAPILRELATVNDGSAPNWILDLSTTSLFGLLCHWGGLFDEVEVYCDRSKPLEAETGFLKAMIGRTDEVTVRMFGKERPYTFNLARLPELVDSKDHPGVQIADVIASALASVFLRRLSGKLDSTEKEWLRLAKGAFGDEHIWPDFDHADPGTRDGFVNSAVLMEIVGRSLRKECLFDGMPEFIEAAHESYEGFRSHLERSSSN